MARRQLAYYSAEGGSVHKSPIDRDGFGEDWRRLRKARAKDDLAAMESAITDDMLDTYALAGTREEVRDRLRALDGHVDTIILEPPSWRLEMDQVLAICRSIIEVVD